MYPAIRLRIRLLRTSLSSETIFLLCSKSAVNSFGESFASSIATRLMYVGRILPNDSLRVRFGRPSKGSALDKGSSEASNERDPKAREPHSVVRRALCGQLLNTNLGYARLRTRPRRSPGATEDGRV